MRNKSIYELGILAQKGDEMAMNFLKLKDVYIVKGKF